MAGDFPRGHARPAPSGCSPAWCKCSAAARAHHGYLFANARATRIKLLVDDGFGVWCADRRLNQGRFAWPCEGYEAASPMTQPQPQFDALVLGLLWQRLEQMQVITCR